MTTDQLLILPALSLLDTPIPGKVSRIGADVFLPSHRSARNECKRKNLRCGRRPLGLLPDTQ